MKIHLSPMTRRDFIRKSSGGIAGSMILSPLVNTSFSFKNEKLGIALIGLGQYSKQILAPALLETKEVYLSGIVTGSMDKAEDWIKTYHISEKNIYNYENFDSISGNDEVNIIYIVLPNSMHKEFAIRAAKAGKHVICEKPMALNAAECREIIRICNQEKVRLSIGYRMHFEPHTQAIMHMGRDKVFGNVKMIMGGAGFNNTNFSNWRMKKEMGGGAMMDMGVYPLNTARNIIGQEPLSVIAQTFSTKPDLYKEVDEVTTFQLYFPGGTIANLSTSFHADFSNIYAAAENGWFRLDPFQAYSGIHGESLSGPIIYPQINQQAVQMDEMALSIRENRPMRVPGEEGLKDMIVVDAIFESIKLGGEKIAIDPE